MAGRRTACPDTSGPRPGTWVRANGARYEAGTSPAGGRPRALLEALEESGLAPARRYRPGEPVAVRGDADALYVLSRGAVKLRVARPGSRRFFMLLVGPWEPFGYASLPRRAGPGIPHAYAEAAAACEVLRLPAAPLERALRSRPEAAAEIVDLLEVSLARRGEAVGFLLPRRTEERLELLLPALAERFGERHPRGRRIRLRLTHRELGEMAGTSRESVSAALKRLGRRGLVVTEGGHIIVADAGRLEVAAMGSG